MIAFSQGDVTLVSFTHPDLELVLPYLRYSDYILRVLGQFPETVTKPMKYVDFKLRQGAGRYISNDAVTEYGRLHEAYQNDIAVIGVVTIPYHATVAVSRTVRETLLNITDLHGKLATFETRLPYRYDAPNPHGRTAFEWLVTMLGVGVPPNHTFVWNDPISLPFEEYTAQQVRSLNNVHKAQLWPQLLPRLFASRRDLAPVRAEVARVLAGFAAERRVPVDAVRKVLGIKV